MWRKLEALRKWLVLHHLSPSSSSLLVCYTDTYSRFALWEFRRSPYFISTAPWDLTREAISARRDLIALADNVPFCLACCEPCGIFLENDAADRLVAARPTAVVRQMFCFFSAVLNWFSVHLHEKLCKSHQSTYFLFFPLTNLSTYGHWVTHEQPFLGCATRLASTLRLADWNVGLSLFLFSWLFNLINTNVVFFFLAGCF